MDAQHQINPVGVQQAEGRGVSRVAQARAGSRMHMHGHCEIDDIHMGMEGGWRIRRTRDGVCSCSPARPVDLTCIHEAASVSSKWYWGKVPPMHARAHAHAHPDALAICTEWAVFRSPEFEEIKKGMNNPAIFDGRNLYHPEDVKKQGFYYESIGRPKN